jgi:hypothetical protein
MTPPFHDRRRKEARKQRREAREEALLEVKRKREWGCP